MHYLDETLASSINSQHILDCKWKPIISDFQRFFSKSYSNWCITKDWKTSENLFLNTVNRAHSKIIYDNLVRMVKMSISLGSFPEIDLLHFLATSFRTNGISSLAPLNKRVTRWPNENTSLAMDCFSPRRISGALCEICSLISQCSWVYVTWL